MTASNPLADLLAPMAGTLQSHVTWAVGAILESDVRVSEPFRLTDAAPGGSSLFCLIPNANPRYHAQLAVGLSKEALPGLFPGEVDPRLRLDSLGELANVVSGLLTADEDFLASFGHLKASTPFFSEGDFTDRKDLGIRGAVTVNGTPLVFHLTIRRAGPEGWVPATAPGEP